MRVKSPFCLLQPGGYFHRERTVAAAVVELSRDVDHDVLWRTRVILLLYFAAETDRIKKHYLANSGLFKNT